MEAVHRAKSWGSSTVASTLSNSHVYWKLDVLPENALSHMHTALHPPSTHHSVWCLDPISPYLTVRICTV